MIKERPPIVRKSIEWFEDMDQRPTRSNQAQFVWEMVAPLVKYIRRLEGERRIERIGDPLFDEMIERGIIL